MTDDRTPQQRLHPSKDEMEICPVSGVVDDSSTDFDLYIETGFNLSLYAKAPYAWSRAELRRLIDDGHTSLTTSNRSAPRSMLTGSSISR